MIVFTSFSVESGTYPTSRPTGLTGNFLAGKAFKHKNLYNTVAAIHFEASFVTSLLDADIMLSIWE